MGSHPRVVSVIASVNVVSRSNLSNCAQPSFASSGNLLFYRNWILDMALNEDADWELVAAQVNTETDSEKLRELAAKFNRVLNEREQQRRQQETKSV